MTFLLCVFERHDVKSQDHCSKKSRLPLRCRLRQEERRRDLLGAEASGRHALHGETLKRLENTCDLREMWLVVYGYVIKSVM